MREDMSGAGRRNPNHKKGGRHPPSPPTLDDPRVHYDPQFIQQQSNAAVQYPRSIAYSHRRLEANAPGQHYDGANPADSRLYMNSQLNTAYNSPDQHQLHIGQYGAPEFQGPYHDPYNLGVGIQYDEYGNPIYADADYHGYSGTQQPRYEQHPGNAYYNPPGMMQAQYPVPVGYYTNSPPTPAASDQIGDRKRAKGSNRPIAPHKPTDTPRVTPDDIFHPGKAPRRKSSESPAKPTKQAKTKRGKGDVPVLTAPLSELTKSYDHIPLKDMDEWVNRSVETRLKECNKKEGWIPRPMNSFMLYRSAYAERTKHWCLQNNHQVVSSVSGLSWPMEPPEIRERFIEYARQERENHAKAHPGYKFSPAKTDASRRKRKGATKEQDDDESVDLEELDYDWQPGRSNKNPKRKGKSKRAKTGYDLQNPVNLEFQVEEYETHATAQPSPIDLSTFEHSNPGKRRPHPLDSLEHGEYYEAFVDASCVATGRVEDVSFLKAEAPHSNGEPKEELVGLPGADHHELLVDPRLDGDTFNSDSNAAVMMPLDPHPDSSFLDGLDFSQLSGLDDYLGETILQNLGDAGLFDTPESNTIGPPVSGNQYTQQNEAENGDQKNAQSSAQNEGLNEYENGYQNVYQAVNENQCPEEVEVEQPNEIDNRPEQKSISADHSPKPQKIPRKLDEGKPGIEKVDNEKTDDEKPSDENLGDEKLEDEKPDYELGREELNHRPVDIPKPSSTKK